MRAWTVFLTVVLLLMWLPHALTTVLLVEHVYASGDTPVNKTLVIFFCGVLTLGLTTIVGVIGILRMRLPAESATSSWSTKLAALLVASWLCFALTVYAYITHNFSFKTGSATVTVLNMSFVLGLFGVASIGVLVGVVGSFAFRVSKTNKKEIGPEEPHQQ
jgi:hypothetical protein